MQTKTSRARRTAARKKPEPEMKPQGPALAAPVLVLAVYILTAAVGMLDASALGAAENIYLSAIVVRLIVYVLPGIFYIKLKGSGYTLRLGFAPIGPGKLAYSAAMLGVLIAIIMLLRVTVMKPSDALPTMLPMLAEYAAGLGGGADELYILVAFAALPALCEELVFRSILLTEYSEYGCIVAVFASALLYAMLGFSAGDFPVFFIIGIITGIAYYTTRSILSPILIRLGFGIYTIWLDEGVARLLSQPTNAVFLTFLVVVILLVLVIAVLGASESIYYIYGTSSLATPSYYDEKRKLSKCIARVFFSPTMLACIGVFFVLSLFGIPAAR